MTMVNEILLLNIVVIGWRTMGGVWQLLVIGNIILKS